MGGCPKYAGEIRLPSKQNKMCKQVASRGAFQGTRFTCRPPPSAIPAYAPVSANRSGLNLAFGEISAYPPHRFNYGLDPTLTQR